MNTLQSLLAQRATLDAQIAQTKSNERMGALTKIRDIMEVHNLQIADLNTRKPQTIKGKKVAAKYKNEATNESWSGRGLMPKWLKMEVDTGSTLADFEVGKQQTRPQITLVG
jgi:DNA-binding protein H-NS